MSALRIATALAAALTLSGCIVTPIEPLPEERGAVVPGQPGEGEAGRRVEESGVEVERVQPIEAPEPVEAQPLAPPPLSNPAVAALVARANEFSASGQWDMAAAELERGVRIAPQDGQVWLLLAEARYQQGQIAQAVQLARRAQTLVAPGSGLALRAQALIDKATGL
jgi:tetratricopeptide (TPR) repeat protein